MGAASNVSNVCPLRGQEKSPWRYSHREYFTDVSVRGITLVYRRKVVGSHSTVHAEFGSVEHTAYLGDNGVDVQPSVRSHAEVIWYAPEFHVEVIRYAPWSPLVSLAERFRDSSAAVRPLKF